jgi:hypothetical protein
MEERKTDLPIYLYVTKCGNEKNFHFEGDLCEGRKPTNEEYDIFIKHKIPDIIRQHFIAGVRNPLYRAEIIGKFTKHKGPFKFPTLESLIYRAIETYARNGYTSGLVLGFDAKNPLPDKVLLVGDGGYKTEVEFLYEAQKNDKWSKMLQ